MYSHAHFFQVGKIVHLLLRNSDCIVPRDGESAILDHSHYGILSQSHCAILSHSDFVVPSDIVCASSTDSDYTRIIDSQRILYQLSIFTLLSGSQFTLNS